MSTYREYAQAGKELLGALPTLNADELENGMKCLGILYLELEGMDFVEEMNAPRLYEMVSKRCMTRQFDLMVA